MVEQSIIQTLRAAWPIHKEGAQLARDLFDSWCSDGMRRRVPGMGTTERLAIRLYAGKSIEEAAAKEYLYRWHLAIKAPDQCGAAGTLSRNPEQRHRDRPARNACVSVFGTPHTIGM